MKRLILSSSGQFVTDSNLDLFGYAPADLKWLYITTAGNDVPDRTYLDIHKEQLEKNRINYDELDLTNKDEIFLDDKISNVQVVYMEGGNTFYLLKMIRRSGFEKVLKKYLEKGLIYIGSSAGSYVACPTIEMATWKEKITGPRFNHNGITDFKAMNLVPFLVFAHYEDKYRDLIKEEQKQIKYPLKILNDDQAVKVTGDKIELIGDKKKIYI